MIEKKGESTGSQLGVLRITYFLRMPFAPTFGEGCLEPSQSQEVGAEGWSLDPHPPL